MKKWIISLLLALVLAATLLPVQAWGATVVDSGYCGGRRRQKPHLDAGQRRRADHQR